MPHIKPHYLHAQHGVGYHGSFAGIANEALAKNDIVLAIGHSGGRIKWAKADSNDPDKGVSGGVMGVADHAAASGGDVRIVSHKLVTGVDTSASSAAGYPVYLSETPGGWVATAPTNKIVIGSVVEDNASTGAVLLAPGKTAFEHQAS